MSRNALSVSDVVARDAATYKSSTVFDLLSLKGKVTVVTGAGRGIGLVLARTAAELGSSVALLDVLPTPADDLSELERDFDIRAKYYRADVTEFTQLAEVFDQVKHDFGHIDNCITAAGLVLDKPFLDHEWEESARIMNVNVLGSFFSAQLAAKAMVEHKRGGSIVLICSGAAHASTPSRRMSIYSASKGAIWSLTKNLAVEMAPLNIRVNCVSPGFIATEMVLDAASKDEKIWEQFRDGPPLKRIGLRSEIKGSVGYLLSEAAAFTTGTDILVDGGITSGRI
ncbi:short-chain dehydrogenase/reductase SDR [Exophiala viscosa]|uniref:Short-chain dehydrogenase/reductase SDR n=1 Tax=Exophiala viscosa TaxID=2486360 RepID=A0AAN6DLQ2_9EURO|nr:short-chain dehydrogenase/reductase SDR [Exophiala viscosa]